MKKFKLLSLLTAASISVSCIAGFAISASADEPVVAAPYVVDSDSGSVDKGTTLINNDDVTVVTEIDSSTRAGYKLTEDKGLEMTSNGSMQIRVNADPSTENPYGTQYTDTKNNTNSASLAIKPKKTGTLTLYYRRQSVNADGINTYKAADGKDIKVSKAGDKVAITEGGEFTTQTGLTAADGYAFVKQTFKLEKEQEYVAWARGTTIQLCAIDYEADEEIVEPTTVSAENVGVTRGTDGSVATAFKAQLVDITGALKLTVTSQGDSRDKSFNTTQLTDANAIIGFIIKGLDDEAAEAVISVAE